MPETKQYGIIYADPPWHYDRKHGSGVAENHYPTMSIEEICALPVSELAAKDSAGLDKAEREIRCLRTIFPALFRSIEDDDLLAGRLDFLPIGFGSVTSIGGVSHYCVFHKLRSFKEQLDSAEEKARVNSEICPLWSFSFKVRRPLLLIW